MTKKISSMLIIMALTLFLQTSAMAQTSFVDDFEGSSQMTQAESSGQEGISKGEHKHHGKMGKNFQKHHEQIMKELGLTEEQQNNLKAHKEASKEQIKNLMSQMKQEKEKMFKVMSDPNSTKDQMLQQQDKLSSLHNQMSRIRIENLAYMKSILTTEQKAKFQEMSSKKMQQHMQRFQQRCKNGQKQTK